MPFDPPDINTDTAAAIDQILDAVSTALPGWVAVEGSLETALAEEFAAESVIVAQAAVDAIATAVAGIGETVFGIPVRVGAAATISVQLAVTEAGALIPAGFTVTGTSGSGAEVAFTLPADTTSTGTTVSVLMTSTEGGDIVNGVPPGLLTIATATATVISATALTASSGGTNEETKADYLNRVVNELSVLRFGGVRATDLAVLAQSVVGVDRALCIDLYDPAAPATPAERTVTVVAINAENQSVSAEVGSDVADIVAAAREVNFVVNVGTPTYTVINIAYSAIAQAGADPATTKSYVDAVLADYLLQWGRVDGDPHSWVETTTLRFLDIVRVAGNAAGVAYFSTFTVNGGTADVTMAGPAALPKPLDATTSPSTITGTVT